MEINIENFKSFLESKGLADTSVKIYLYYYSKFDLKNLCQDYIVWYVQRFNRLPARAFLKNFFQFLKINGFKYDYDIPKFTGRRSRKVPNVLSRDQVHALAMPMKMRDRIMTLLSFYCGLRLNELLTIKPYDFDWSLWLANPYSKGRLKIKGKGDKERNVTVVADLMNLIYHWIKEEFTKNHTSDNTLFKMSPRRWEYILEFWSMRTLNRRVNPHLLRHSSATFLYESGLDIVGLAEFLGHESIATTQIYAHINKEKLASKIEELFEREE